jgi:hypothetical protein
MLGMCRLAIPCLVGAGYDCNCSLPVQSQLSRLLTTCILCCIFSALIRAPMLKEWRMYAVSAITGCSGSNAANRILLPCRLPAVRLVGYFPGRLAHLLTHRCAN